MIKPSQRNNTANKKNADTARPPSTQGRSLHASFAFRLGMAISLLSIVGAVLLVYLAVRQHWELAHQQASALGRTLSEQFAASVLEPIFTDDELALQLNVNQLASKPMVRSASIYAKDGVVLASSLSEPMGYDRLTASHFASPVTLSGTTAAYAVIEIDRSLLENVFDSSSRDLIIAVCVIVIVTLLWAYGISRLLARPVHRLQQMSNAAREGRLQMLKHLLSKQERNEWGDIMTVYGQLQEEVQSKRQIQRLLGQFVATDVAEQLMGAEDGFQVDGERVDASVLFVDIVNFTQIAEPMPPEDVANMLNRYLSTFAACARIYQGMVDKFIGDAAMIVFGTPRADKQHREHALACASAIQAVARQINSKRESIGLKPIDLRIGINSGTMRAGILGSEYRKEFTVVGDAVNLASRLCGSADPGQVLVSENTVLPLHNMTNNGDLEAVSEGSIMVKGKAEPVEIFRLVDIRSSKSWVLANLIEDIVSEHD